jgi:hypothetical protein
MDLEELRERIESILDPEPEPDLSPREVPHPRLERVHGLDLSYLNTADWEGSSIHKHTRLSSSEDDALHTLTRNLDVAIRLFEAGLRLFGDSVLVYHGRKDRKSQLRFYPPALLTFWSGFETFVRYASELMLITVPSIPQTVASYLREEEIFVNQKGEVDKRPRYQPVLDRYVAVLRHGYGFKVDRGAKWWQDLEAARRARDYYTHLDVMEARALSSRDVIQFMEAVLVGLIHPSAQVRRTLLLGSYELYWQWSKLSDVAEEYTEEPFFKDWPFEEGLHQFQCNFDNVDESLFPSARNPKAYGEKLRKMRGDPK